VAIACLLGLPADRLLHGDSLERTFWLMVAGRAVELSDQARENQANANANAIAEVLRRMFRRRGARRG
jgi:hypothetical protein